MLQPSPLRSIERVAPPQVTEARRHGGPLRVMGVQRRLELKPAGCRGRGWFLTRRGCWRLLAAAECKDADEEDGEGGPHLERP